LNPGSRLRPAVGRLKRVASGGVRVRKPTGAVRPCGTGQLWA